MTTTPLQILSPSSDQWSIPRILSITNSPYLKWATIEDNNYGNAISQMSHSPKDTRTHTLHPKTHAPTLYTPTHTPTLYTPRHTLHPKTLYTPRHTLHPKTHSTPQDTRTHTLTRHTHTHTLHPKTLYTPRHTHPHSNP